MKKRLSNTKAFAMAELLAVSLIVLTLFSVLFANYLPLVAQYENSMNYNDVTAEYAAFYIRKAYKSALEDINIQNQIDEKIKNGYYTVYSKSNDIKDISFLANASFIEDIISEYNIDEIIITSNDLKVVKSSYERNKPLYNYINYLPINNSNDDIEKYRIFLRTSSFGYATTEVLVNDKTPAKCFKTSNEKITDYLCGKDNNGKDTILEVVIPNKINGYIIKTIGENSFKDKGIKSIAFSNSIETIESSAFENNKIKEFNFEKKNLGIKVIQDNAFKNNNLEQVTILDSIQYGTSVFANNYNISKISFKNSENSIKEIPDSLFSLDKKGTNTFKLIIPSSVEKIGKESFKNVSINNLTFQNEDSLIIGEKAFEGNSLENVLFSSGISEGLNIFGDSLIGSKKGQINLQAKSLEEANNIFVSVNWCKLLYGTDCNGEEAESNTYKYTHGESVKYVTYIQGVDNYE